MTMLQNDSDFLNEKIKDLQDRVEHFSKENLRLKTESRDRLSALRHVENELQSIQASLAWPVLSAIRVAEKKLASIRSRFSTKPGAFTISQSSVIRPGPALSDVIDIVVPIYRGLAETQRCLESVFANSQNTKFELIVVNDCSPEPSLTEYLRLLKSEGKITLIENETNLGFAGAVTVGIAQHPDRDVVLLNSDTVVSNNWLDRMIACARNHEAVGTVTPFSNNGAITSYPKILAVNDVPSEITLSELDALFARVNAGSAVQLPVGVGFCMYISRTCFNTINGFDIDKFGAGYGEENDFCLRAEAAGFKNLLCADTFVYHEGAVSFREKEVSLKRKATQTLLRNFPDYLERVGQYLRNDPSLSFRVAVDLERIQQSRKPGRLFIGDSSVTSVERHVTERALRDGDVNTFYLHPLPDSKDGDDYELRWLNRGEYLGMLVPASELQSRLPALAQLLRIKEVECHLVNQPGEQILKAINSLQVPPKVVLHETFRESGQREIIDAFRSLAGVRFVVPSEAAGRAAELSQTEFDIEPTSWSDPAPLPAVNMYGGMASGNLRVAVIGPAGEEEFRTIQLCAIEAAAQNFELEIHYLGAAKADSFTAPRANLIIHSQVQNAEDVQLTLSWLKPNVLLYCGKEPASFSYRLEDGLKSGIAIIATEHGDYAARLSLRPLTWLVAPETSASRWARLLHTEVRSALCATPAFHPAPASV